MTSNHPKHTDITWLLIAYALVVAACMNAVCVYVTSRSPQSVPSSLPPCPTASWHCGHPRPMPTLFESDDATLPAAGPGDWWWAWCQALHKGHVTHVMNSHQHTSTRSSMFICSVGKPNNNHTYRRKGMLKACLRLLKSMFILRACIKMYGFLCRFNP